MKNIRLDIVIGSVLTLAFLIVAFGKLSPDAKHSEIDNDLKLKFDLLSNAKTNLCSSASFISGKSDNERLQGSCCSPMDFHRYTEQVNGLRKYKNIDKIPKDPYDISVPLAKELLAYQEIKLTSAQQDIYDNAVKISHEGGPCCCKCWRWYAFDGLAKYLITENNFDSEQVAELWDLEDGCGGSGHSHYVT